MALSKRQFIQYLKDADFRTLFIEEMGWNKYSTAMADIPTFFVEDKSFDIKTIAHRNGFQILQCFVEELPSNSVCKKLDTKLRKAANDYICIFIVSGTEHHEWVAPVKTNEKRDIVIIEYAEAEKAEFLYEKISGLSFDIDEVTTIVDVKARVQGTFAVNSEKITKDFYSGFAKEHKSFAGFITGIDDQIATKDNKNKQWYTSVMLNRLMFCYFIQKKGFLNGDENYLRNKLRWVQEKKGNNKFFKSFYKGFLVQLFRGGLNSPTHDDAFEDVYGRIPYLNGGMFDVHQIERDYEGIDIKDEAFESLFEFFDKWRWHLDTRVTASGRDINPDVLGYIFEQYINDRAQMGAYYTKEDITEYIGRNTIIPYLFDATSKKYPEAFKPEGAFWTFFRERGDEFIYDAVKKGAGQAIPDEIACGIDTEAPDLLERRKLWNNTTPENIGLPTEIWRETIERLQRYQEVKNKIESGEICSVNDFITYNLNIPKIAYDFLNSTEDKKFIEVFYAELRKVTILDPTCGSGAFLFAALNLLEPLYEVCISRMEEYNAQDHTCFSEQLSEIKNKYRSNIQYFIYKSIILRNLYGVDIMAEAVEIAKLRLFLKMVAVVDVDKRAENMGLDPLPDIDFNIRCGNTLVGYATEEQLNNDLDFAADFLQQLANQELKERLHAKLRDVADTYEIFRMEQLIRDADVSILKEAKSSLNRELRSLNELLNKHLFAASGYSDFDEWLAIHQPFHWLAEFYQIMHNSKGFDVVIGNPPYVEFPSDDVQYSLNRLASSACGNLYGCCTERALIISHSEGRFSFIVPVAITCSKRMTPVISLIKEKANMALFANFDDRPGKLFEMLQHLRATIFIVDKTAVCNNPRFFATKYNRWYSECRDILFANLRYVEVSDFVGAFTIPKYSYPIELSIKKKLLRAEKCLSSTYGLKSDNNNVYYRAAGGGYFLLIKTDKSVTYIDGALEDVKAEKFIPISTVVSHYNVASVLSSSLFYWDYIAYTDCRNLTKSFIDNFRVSESLLKDVDLAKKGKALFSDYERNKYKKNTYYQTTGRNVIYYEYYPKLSKSLIDIIDEAIAPHYRFTPEEVDFIINFDIKFRMGDNLE